ncbi:MAG: D-alanyl-D-alanine carboxypeptidase, partial [Clostridia bacterium]|nr:D-alanyl-D-alanine carboxypeptidase [Clostridia bacterium]
DELVHPSGRKTEIVNTNKLVKYYQGCDSGKTGFTDEAGYCLASSVKRDDMRLVSVVLGTKNAKARFNESVKLLNYGFANFSNELIVDNEKSLSLENVFKSETKTAEVFASENFFGLVKKGEEADFAVSYELNGKLVAPLKAGDVVGQVIVTKNGVVVKEIDLIIKQDIEQINFSQSMKKIIEMW